MNALGGNLRTDTRAKSDSLDSSLLSSRGYRSVHVGCVALRGVGRNWRRLNNSGAAPHK